jgi:cytochrome c oxidase accessory protein FixG
MSMPATPATEDFRDHIPTADARGHRIWVYPRKPRGALYRLRTWVSWALLAILFAGPFLRVGDNPLLMMNFVERKFSLFGQLFWPQDLYIFALLLLTIFIMIVLFTAAFGRVWCGWLCPQTVLMEMVFRKIEYWLEGDAHEQRALRDAPWTGGKLLKKGAKHAIFFGLSFLIGNWLLMYIIGSDAWFRLVTDDPRQHVTGLSAMILFSLLFYGIFARFREQACTFICPYGRFQSVLLDNNSIVVAYDHRRGDPRQRFQKSLPHEARRAAGIGDCIQCGLCVDVCPTGIDIRNGTQMECVNCTACIDACNGVMDRVQFPRGLIRYASQNHILKGERPRFTVRIAAYCAVLTALCGVLAYILGTRADVETQLLRAPGSLYQTLPDGHISNLYLVKVVNKTTREIPVELKLEDPAEGRLEIAGQRLVVPREKLTQSAVVVTLPQGLLEGPNRRIAIGVYEEGRKLKTLRTNFVGPGTAP